MKHLFERIRRLVGKRQFQYQIICSIFKLFRVLLAHSFKIWTRGVDVASQQFKYLFSLWERETFGSSDLSLRMHYSRRTGFILVVMI